MSVPDLDTLWEGMGGREGGMGLLLADPNILDLWLGGKGGGGDREGIWPTWLAYGHEQAGLVPQTARIAWNREHRGRAGEGGGLCRCRL
jgi:hypothetical protein